jgi:manganese/iron transport system permease protein
MHHLFVEPFQVEFMQRALVEAVVLGVFGGVLGVHVVLRRLAFISDALTHTIFPGVAIAFFLNTSLFFGALAAGALSAVLLTILTRHKRVTNDAALAILLTSFFSVGVIVVSRGRSFSSDLTSLLFGRLLTVSWGDVAETATAMAVVFAILALVHKELLYRSFDEEGARAAGYRVALLDFGLNLLITLFVVAAVKAVGTVLVIALLVTPAAAAQLVARSVPRMMVVAGVTGAVAGWLGLVVSYNASVDHDVRLAAGGTVVLVVTVLFVVVLAAVKTRSLLAHRTELLRFAGDGA